MDIKKRIKLGIDFFERIPLSTQRVKYWAKYFPQFSTPQVNGFSYQ